jgi:hypothetical protein
VQQYHKINCSGNRKVTRPDHPVEGHQPSSLKVANQDNRNTEKRKGLVNTEEEKEQENPLSRH